MTSFDGDIIQIHSMSQKVKVYVEDLAPGMYVCELDRPWIETPFLFQGFMINTAKELQLLREWCQYVFVDQQESIAPVGADNHHHYSNHAKAQSANTQSAKAQKDAAEKHEIPAQDEFDYPAFQRQLEHALAVHRDAHDYIRQMMEDVRIGKLIDARKAKLIVSHLADSIVQNTTALIWLTNLKNRDEYTSQHSLNVCILSLLFGQHLKLDREELSHLGTGALLHDIGKLKVPVELLNKPGRLTSEEFRELQKHPVYGYELLKDADDLHPDALDIVLHHHERLDGSGYPHKLTRGRIGRFVRIVAIVDVYDAVTSDRVYHNEDTPYAALNKLYHQDNGTLDQSLLEQFIKCIGIYPVGSVVELNTGHVGVVMSISEKHHLQPIVMLLLNHQKQPYERHRFINLANPKIANSRAHPAICKISNPRHYGFDLSSLYQIYPVPKAV